MWDQAGPKVPGTTLLWASLGAELARGELRQDLNSQEPGRVLVMLAKNVTLYHRNKLGKPSNMAAWSRLGGGRAPVSD